MREERQEPEAAQSQAKSRDEARLCHAARAGSLAEPATHSDQEQRGRRVSGVDEDDGGDERRGSERSPTRACDPAGERERHEGQKAPAEPRGDESPAQTLLDAAPRSRRQRQRHEGAGQGEPTAPEDPGQKGEGGEAGQEPRDPELGLIRRGNADGAHGK